MSDTFNGIELKAAVAYAKDFLLDPTSLKKGNTISALKNQLENTKAQIIDTQVILARLQSTQIDLEEQLELANIDLINTIATKLSNPITY